MRKTIDALLALIGKYRLELMGAAIIWVMMLHGSELYSGVRVPLISAVAKRGNLGVDMFLFLSGFGLWFSLEKNSDIRSFYRRRMKRVLLPYLILALPFWAYNTLHLKAGVSRFLADYTGISFVTKGVVTTWYVFLIVALYLVYPLIHRWEKKRGLFADIVMIAACIACCLVLRKTHPGLYGRIEIALTRVPAFILGSLAARAATEKAKAEACFLAVYTVLAVFVFFLYLPVKRTDPNLSVVLYRFGGAGIAVAVICLFSLVYDTISRRTGGFRSRPLQHLGTISLELYLLHIFLRALLRHRNVGADASALEQTLIWFLTVVAAVALGTVFHYLYERISSRAQRRNTEG